MAAGPESRDALRQGGVAVARPLLPRGFLLRFLARTLSFGPETETETEDRGSDSGRDRFGEVDPSDGFPLRRLAGKLSLGPETEDRGSDSGRGRFGEVEPSDGFPLRRLAGKLSLGGGAHAAIRLFRHESVVPGREAVQ
jgi:hypothetical protein